VFGEKDQERRGKRRPKEEKCCAAAREKNDFRAFKKKRKSLHKAKTSKKEKVVKDVDLKKKRRM